MITTFLATALASGCMDLAEGEEAWMFELRPVLSDVTPLPLCGQQTDLEIRLQRDEAGELRAIYFPSENPHVDAFTLVTEEDGAVALTTMRAIGGGQAERWDFDLSTWADDNHDAYVGFASQDVLSRDGVLTCRSVYLANVKVYRG